MMFFSDETLMAYADGELDASTREAIEAAMAIDPTVAQRVAHHRAMREDVYASFAPILDERVPARLRAAARNVDGPTAPVTTAAPATIIEFSQVRAARALAKKGRWSWPEWGALAATLIVGVLVGKIGLPLLDAGGQMGESGSTVATVGGQVTAEGKLAQALAQQLASAPLQDQSIRIGVSFRSGDGQYCRSFALNERSKHAGALAGLACLKPGPDGQWQIPVLVQSPAEQGTSDKYRMAGSAMPALVLQAIDERIVGQPLDAEAERAALQHHWRP